jgi:hypothetical protein
VPLQLTALLQEEQHSHSSTFACSLKYHFFIQVTRPEQVDAPQTLSKSAATERSSSERHFENSLPYVKPLAGGPLFANMERTLATFFLVMKGRGTAAPEMIEELLLSLCPLTRLEDKEVVAPDRTALAAILSDQSFC